MSYNLHAKKACEPLPLVLFSANRSCLNVRFANSFIGILIENKLGSDGNQQELVMKFLGGFGPAYCSTKWTCFDQSLSKVNY